MQGLLGFCCPIIMCQEKKKSLGRRHSGCKVPSKNKPALVWPPPQFAQDGGVSKDTELSMPKSGQSWVNENVWSPEIWCPGTFTFGSCSGFQDQPGLHSFRPCKGDSGAPKSLLFLISSSALHLPLSVFLPYPSSPLRPNSGQQVFPKNPLCAQLSPWGKERTPKHRLT